MTKFIYQSVRVLLFPWLFTYSFFGRFRTRYQFEKKYWIKSPISVDVVFHVSSEGELEQARPLIEDDLQESKKVLLIFTSESVEHRAIELKNRYQGLLIMALPVLSYLPWSRTDIAHMITAKKLFMVRYDFFPELLFWARDLKLQSILLWANLSKSKNNMLNRWVYLSFDKIVTGLARDRELLINVFGFDPDLVLSADLRPYQILRRLEKRAETLKIKWPAYSQYLDILNQFSKNKRIIFGNYWEYEESMFKDTEIHMPDYAMVIVPHRLDLDELTMMAQGLKRTSKREVVLVHYVMKPEEMHKALSEWQKLNAILILGLKGILCELYADYAFAYVSGGYGRSVHSLLEPFVAQAQVICGPRIERSTEYDYIKEKYSDAVCVIESMNDVLPFIKKKMLLQYSSMSSQDEKEIFSQYKHTRQWIGDV